MKTILKVVTLCCALAVGVAALAPEVMAGPGGRGQDKMEKNAGHGNQNKDWDLGGGGGKGNNPIGGLTKDLAWAGISLEAARQLALGGGYIGYKPLPPGSVKNLARGKPLPPGIAKRMVPGPLLSKLPVHPGYEWRVLGSDLVLVYAATSVIADILHDVFH